MSFLLKDIYSKKFYDTLSEVLILSIPSFDKNKFLTQIFVPEFKNFELKERMLHTAKVLHNFLPIEFNEASKLLITLVKNLHNAGIKENSIEFMFLPEYISHYGLDDYKSSVRAIEFITQFTSCEFAVRPFIIKYGDKMIAQMLKWSRHPSHKVRRLSTEGIRPRLPWAMALPKLKQDPSPILPILENLYQDEFETVRRSVANNLNDISKDNPNVTLNILKEWKGTDALIKHASRTLLKKGNPEILRFYGLSGSSVDVMKFKLLTPVVKMRESLDFRFELRNLEKKKITARIEYKIFFLLNNGTLSGKVFKISERELQPGKKLTISKRHVFREITTRKYYNGEHKVAIITNGKMSKPLSFQLNIE